MTAAPQSVTIQLPDLVYRRLQRAADLTHRSVEEVLVSTVNIALPASEDIPSKVADDLAAMTLLSDDELRSALFSMLTVDQQQRLQELNDIADRRLLTTAEQAELDNLVKLYDIAVLRRAKAMATLAYRGHAIEDELSLANQDEQR
ncbi:MAG: hypothetical protein R2844_12285 [Caldilineales bacterium]